MILQQHLLQAGRRSLVHNRAARRILSRCIPLVLLLFVAAFGSAAAQDIPDSKGREFWVTFPPNYHNNLTGQEDSLYIYIAADEPTRGQIEYFNRDGDRFVEDFVIDDPDEVYQFQIVFEDFELEGYNRSGFLNNARSQNEIVAAQHFHITSEDEVTVYGLNMARTTSDAFLALPQDVLGLSYRIMAYNSDFDVINDQLDFGSTPSQFAVVATADGTEVTIRPSTETQDHGLDVQRVRLDRGEVYLVQARFDTDDLRRDLTGTLVTATDPIAVFAGHQRSTIPVENSDMLISRDYLIQQMLPTNTWGRNAFVVPMPQTPETAPEGDDIFRVLASSDDTQVMVNGAAVATLDAGEIYEATITGPLEVQGSKAVQVAQFKKTSNNQFSDPDAVRSDPFMLLLPPKEQFLKSYRCINAQALQQLGNPPREDEVFTLHYATVIAETDDRANVRLDGNAVNVGDFTRIGSSDFWFAHLEVDAGVHTVESQQPIGLYVLGYGLANSYAYIGGLGQETIECTAAVSPPSSTICRGDEIQLMLDITGFEPSTTVFEWTPSEGLSDPSVRNPIASPSENTTYNVVVRDDRGCIAEAQAQVRVRPRPRIKLEDEISICSDDVAVLNPEISEAEGPLTYAWTPVDGLDDPAVRQPRATPSATQMYYLRVSDEAGCDARDSILVVVIPEIDVEAGPDQQICRGESVVLDAATGAGNDVEIRWTPANGLNNPRTLRPVAAPQQSTLYRVEITAGGCVARDSVLVEVNPAPRFQLRREAVICTGDEVQLEPFDIQGENLTYQWNPIDGLDDPTIAAPLATPTESITYRLTVETPAGCRYTDSIEVVVEACEGCDEISGIVNTYHAVESIAPASGRLRVADTTGLRPGLQVLIIQMQGAEIYPDNDEKYGSITNLNGAGLYEFAVVKSVSGFDVRLEERLQNEEYDISGKIQLISVPAYSHIIVSGELTCRPWDGETGGVLALSAECLMLEADLNVDGRGFRGAEFENYPPCNVSPHRVDYVTDEDCYYSPKGEGVAEDGIGAFRYGRGSPANAGGGGNNHNAGGGGGAGLGAGGAGGFGFRGVVENRRFAGGIGGKSAYQNDFIRGRHAFAGGGGGCGHSNHRHGSGGADGGGIVIVRGGTLKSSGDFGISARGAKADDDFSTLNPDGLGGGGAGGSVLLDVRQVVSGITVDVSGGKGGSRLGNEHVTAGPGGGGGGGYVGLLAADAVSRDNLTIVVDGGPAGDALEGGTYGAEDGEPGAVLSLQELRGDLAATDFGECRGCYPVLSDSSGGCGGAQIRVLDAGARIQSVELVDAESNNTAIDVEGLGSIAASIEIRLLDDAVDGVAHLLVTNSTGRSETFTVELLALPPRPTITLADKFQLLSSEAPHYQWRYQGRDINNNGNSRGYKPESEGLFTVLITDERGCSNESEAYEYRITTSVGDELAGSQPQVFPNPFDNRIRIDGLPKGEVSIELLNILGERVLHRTIGNGVENVNLEAEGLPAGVYMLNIRRGAEQWSIKLIRR